MIHRCYPQTTLNILVSFHSPTLGMTDMFRTWQPKAVRQPRIITKEYQNLINSIERMSSAHKALVWPQLKYASAVWSPWQRYFVDSNEKVQHHSAHYIYNNYHSDSSVSIMIKNLHWKHDKLSVAWLCSIKCLIT